MKKILFVTYGGGHVTTIAPVALNMKSLGYDVVILALTTAYKYLSTHDINISYLGLKDLPCSQTEHVQFYGKKLTENLSNAVISVEESIAYMGLSYIDLIEQHGEAKAKQLYETHGRQAFLPVQTLKKVIQWLQPHAVVATNSPRAEQAAIIAAGEMGIPALCLVDLFAIQEIQWIGQPGYANKVCVLNQEVRRRFIDYGRQPEEIIVTGNPAFDRLQSPDIKLAGITLKQKRNWDDGKITLLWASQIEPERHPFQNLLGDPTLPDQVESTLRKFIREHKQFRLVIRYHPSQKVEFVQQERVTLSPNTENLHKLLYAVEGVIVIASTVGLEASLAGKVVISVDNSIFFEDSPYSKMGISIGVKSPTELPNKILELYHEGGFTKSDNWLHNTSNDNISATIKVTNVLQSLL